eukprot:847958_1
MSFFDVNNTHNQPRPFSPLRVDLPVPSYPHKTQKKPRKQRIIKNGIVNVDNVHIGRGLRNANWLKIAKQKLTQRELTLLRKRQATLDRLIINAIQSFADPDVNQFNLDTYQTGIRDQLIHPQSLIIGRCSQYIAAVLHKWNGYKPKNEGEIRYFRHYFQRCRHWFDTKKIRIMTIDFWIPNMRLIEQFATNAASQFIGNPPLQQKYSNYLCALIMKRVFEGHIKPANARKMWLIPAMAYPIFLRQFNDNLQIVVNEKSRKNKVIRTQYLRCLNHKCDALRDAFYDEMNRNRRTTTNRSNSNSNRNINAFASDYVSPSVTPPPNPFAYVSELSLPMDLHRSTSGRNETPLPLFPQTNVSSNWVFDDVLNCGEHHLNDSSEFAHDAAAHAMIPMPCRCTECVLSPCDCFGHFDL